MIMKRWRVGSLSMGLVLVASGILMLVSLVSSVNVLEVLLTFWPLILICLGAEILLHLFIRKNDETDVKLRYDALSILFIGFLLIVSIGFYSVTYFFGLFETRGDMYAAFGIRHESVHVEGSTALAEAKELVVFSGFNSITVLAASDDQIRVSYNVSVSTSDIGLAESLLGEGNIVDIILGERAYLRPETTMFRNNSRVGWPVINCVIFLPSDTVLDLSQFWGLLEYDNAIEGQILRYEYE